MQIALLSLFAIVMASMLAGTASGDAKWAWITVTISPEEVTGTARWYLQAGDLHQSGDTVKVNASDNIYYTVHFTEVEDYQAPSNATVEVTVGETRNVSGEYVVSSGDTGVTVNSIANWPLWPQKRASYNVWEPYSFTSIGRDVVSWVVFDPMEGNPTFWLSDLKVMIKTDELTYTRVTPNLDYSYQDYCYIVGTSFKDFPTTLGGIESDLRSFSVHPVYDADWMTSEVNGSSMDYPNQDFSDSWFSYSEWLNFLRGDAGFELEDSGHAPPLTMWAEDNWLTFFVDQNSVPVAWTGIDGDGVEYEKVFLFLPTNQGVLNCFEVSEAPDSPGVKRVWSITPYPAFQQAVYNQVRYENDEAFSRMTVLDGPVYVHDVQDENGAWKRILVGTTGMGTEQVNKVAGNWAVEAMPEPSNPPGIIGHSRIFGIYAIDVTDPLQPETLWSVTNMNCPRDDDASLNNVDVQNASGGNIDAFDYQDVDFMTSKPLIGFTETEEGDRTWHLLLVTVNRNGEYLWINADPMTGEVMSSGTFNGFSGETAEMLPSEDVYMYNFEDWYPSRMLAAYPGEGGLPVLSDVYVYLSNGTFYSWDLNRYGWDRNSSNLDGPVPEKIFNVYTNEGHKLPAPPITDFDIAYIGGDIYLAATAPLDYPGEGQPHDTYGLLIVNLTHIQENNIVDLNTQGAQGQGGDTKLWLMGEGVAMVQLQTKIGGNTYDFDELAASPLFANYVLYQAQYSTNGELSRLYTLDLAYIAGLTRSSGNVTLPDDSYIDDPDNRFAAMTIDSEGNLVIFDEAGNVVYTIEGVLDYSNVGPGTGPTGDSGVRTVYWKVR
jgi:hypothetical protein